MNLSFVSLLLLIYTPHLWSVELCEIGKPVNTNCQVPIDHYVYPLEYGGRKDAGTVIIEQMLSGILPVGWYQNQNVEFRDPELKDYNIKQGESIFGVMGIATQAAFLNDCNLSEGLIANSCKLQATRYYYQQEQGGRSQNCPTHTVANINVDQPCWLDQSNKYINLQTLEACVTGQALAKDCRARQDQYFYNMEFNARSRLCEEGEILNQSCWIDSPNSFVAAGTCNLNAQNALSCVTGGGSSKYVYAQSFGGRGTICTNNNNGWCWFDKATKAASSSGSLAPANIKIGVSIMGVAGTFTGASSDWPSGMHKLKGTNASLYLVNEQSFSDTTSNVNLYDVPKVANSHEGGVNDGAITLPNRAGWVTCGSVGSIAERVTDCNQQWQGDLNGNGGQGIWDLVTRNNTTGLEVWRDKATNLLWSSRVAIATNWCRAVGSSNSLNAVVPSAIKEVDPAGICTNNLFQNNQVNTLVLSACTEDFAGLQMSTTEHMANGKVGLRSNNTIENGRVKWRVPTMYDYALANKHGLRFVLPDAGPIGTEAKEWTATIVSNSSNRQNAIVFDSKTGTRSQQIRSANAAVRCVGR